MSKFTSRLGSWFVPPLILGAAVAMTVARPVNASPPGSKKYTFSEVKQDRAKPTKGQTPSATAGATEDLPTIDVLEGLRTGYYLTTMLVHLGDAYHAAGDPEHARQAWQDALAILEDLNHSDASQVRARLEGEGPPVPGSSVLSGVGGGRLRENHAVGA